MSLDKVAALFVFCADYHSGQDSRFYGILSKLVKKYRPRLNDSAWKQIRSGGYGWDRASEIYAQLVKNLNDGNYHR
jgi:hypothetical protein